MPDTQPAATPPATPPFDAAALEARLGAMIETALGAAMKPVSEAVAKLQAAAPGIEQKAAAAADKAVLTAEAVGQMLDAKLKTFMGQQTTAAARDAFAASKMPDLPAIYRNQLPETADPVALAKAEQSIRSQYQTDFKTAGGTAAAVGSGTGAAGTPAAAVDVSKLSSVDKITLGLKQDGIRTPQGK